MSTGKILTIGGKIKYGGKMWTVGASLFTGGERYYLLHRGEGEVAMIPAFMLEPNA